MLIHIALSPRSKLSQPPDVFAGKIPCPPSRPSNVPLQLVFTLSHWLFFKALCYLEHSTVFLPTRPVYVPYPTTCFTLTPLHSVFFFSFWHCSVILAVLAIIVFTQINWRGENIKQWIYVENFNCIMWIVSDCFEPKTRMFCGGGSLLSLGLCIQTRRGKKRGGGGNFFFRDTKTAQNLTPHSSWDTQGAPIFQASSLQKHKWSVNVPYLYPNESWDKVKEAEIADNVVLEWAVIIL